MCTGGPVRLPASLTDVGARIACGHVSHQHLSNKARGTDQTHFQRGSHVGTPVGLPSHANRGVLIDTPTIALK
jgi:hypothetical protein